MQIFVKTLTGKTITLEVESGDSIDNINLLGWNFYMPPEQAARGIEVFNNINDVNIDSGGSWKYKDLSSYSAWKGYVDE